MGIITIFFVPLQPKCLGYYPPFRADLARQLVDLPDGRDAVPGLSKLLLLARAIKFVFCDSTVAAFLLRVCATWTGRWRIYEGCCSIGGNPFFISAGGNLVYAGGN